MSNNRTRKAAKKAAAEPLSELEKAIREIDLATESANAAKERKPCYCLGTVSPFLNLGGLSKDLFIFRFA